MRIRILALPIAVALAAPGLAADRVGPPLIRLGGDPARGLLVNRTAGARPFDPPDPARPSVVFVHGFNPAPRLVKFGMAEQLAGALARRGGPPVNVLAWDWNAATFPSLRPVINSEAAVDQGHALARSLLAAGVDPARAHLIGHSAGGMVATSAARDLQARGRPAAQLTLLDPATYYHAIIFERLGAGSLAPIVENYWAPGPSAFGREAALPGIRNYRVEGPCSYAGVVYPARSDHLYVVRWYVGTASDPRLASGYNLGPVAAGRVR